MALLTFQTFVLTEFCLILPAYASLAKKAWLPQKIIELANSVSLDITLDNQDRPHRVSSVSLQKW